MQRDDCCLSMGLAQIRCQACQHFVLCNASRGLKPCVLFTLVKKGQEETEIKSKPEYNANPNGVGSSL